METQDQIINDFFKGYEAGFNTALQGKPDTDRTAAAFADCFIAANPAGVTCGKNDDLFRKAIPAGYDFYKTIGIKTMQILSSSISVLDDFHAINKVRWKAVFETKEGKKGVINFNVIYFLQLINQQAKMFGYITGDEQAAMKEHGLI